MKQLSIILFLFVFINCNNESKLDRNVDRNEDRSKLLITHDTNANFESESLSGNTETIELSYIAWGCECANWSTDNDQIKYKEDLDTLAHNSIFIEPTSNSVKLPDTLSYNGTLIKFTGQFYKERGFPENYYKSEQNPESSRVFRYSKYEVMKSYYHPIDWNE